jgi:hypothetical protein
MINVIFTLSDGAVELDFGGAFLIPPSAVEDIREAPRQRRKDQRGGGSYIRRKTLQ